MALFGPYAGFAEIGRLDEERQLRSERRKVAAAFAEFRRQNPHANSSDFQAFISGIAPDFNSLAAIPQQDVIDRISAENQERKVMDEATLRLKHFSQRSQFQNNITQMAQTLLSQGMEPGKLGGEITKRLIGDDDGSPGYADRLATIQRFIGGMDFGAMANQQDVILASKYLPLALNMKPSTDFKTAFGVNDRVAKLLKNIVRQRASTIATGRANVANSLETNLKGIVNSAVDRVTAQLGKELRRGETAPRHLIQQGVRRILQKSPVYIKTLQKLRQINPNAASKYPQISAAPDPTTTQTAEVPTAETGETPPAPPPPNAPSIDPGDPGNQVADAGDPATLGPPTPSDAGAAAAARDKQLAEKTPISPVLKKALDRSKQESGAIQQWRTKIQRDRAVSTYGENNVIAASKLYTPELLRSVGLATVDKQMELVAALSSGDESQITPVRNDIIRVLNNMRHSKTLYGQDFFGLPEERKKNIADAIIWKIYDARIAQNFKGRQGNIKKLKDGILKAHKEHKEKTLKTALTVFKSTIADIKRDKQSKSRLEATGIAFLTALSEKYYIPAAASSALAALIRARAGKVDLETQNPDVLAKDPQIAEFIKRNLVPIAKVRDFVPGKLEERYGAEVDKSLNAITALVHGSDTATRGPATSDGAPMRTRTGEEGQPGAIYLFANLKELRTKYLEAVESGDRELASELMAQYKSTYNQLRHLVNKASGHLSAIEKRLRTMDATTHVWALDASKPNAIGETRIQKHISQLKTILGIFYQEDDKRPATGISEKDGINYLLNPKGGKLLPSMVYAEGRNFVRENDSKSMDKIANNIDLVELRAFTNAYVQRLYSQPDTSKSLPGTLMQAAEAYIGFKASNGGVPGVASLTMTPTRKKVLARALIKLLREGVGSKEEINRRMKSINYSVKDFITFQREGNTGFDSFPAAPYRPGPRPDQAKPTPGTIADPQAG
jgi:hypothetical protein